MSSGDVIQIDMSQYERFFEKLRQAGGANFKRDAQLFLEGLGNEFLRIIQDEIIRLQAVDTRLMLASFSKGDQNNSWKVSDGGLTLTVASTLDYAAWVNNGHWANPSGVRVRFVPGTWSGDRFVYQPGAKGGMILRQQWVEGYHYWESGVRILERMMPKLLDRLMKNWMQKYFG